MRVEVRITGPRGAVTKRGADETFRLVTFTAASSAARPRPLGLEHTYRGGHRSVVRVANLVRSFGIAQREQQRHRLRRAKGRVEPRYLGRPLRAGQSLTRPRVPALEHVVERLGIDLADQSEPRCRAPGPLARCLLRTGVVLLGAGGDRGQVVLLLAGCQLSQAQHWLVPFSAITPATARTSGASASLDRWCMQ
jgi:hypothetical protein